MFRTTIRICYSTSSPKNCKEFNFNVICVKLVALSNQLTNGFQTDRSTFLARRITMPKTPLPFPPPLANFSCENQDVWMAIDFPRVISFKHSHLRITQTFGNCLAKDKLEIMDDFHRASKTQPNRWAYYV